MRLTFGGRVPLGDVVGRDETVGAVWRDVEANSLLINEMRRFGKTTMLRLVEARTPEGWYCVRTSVQDARSTLDLIELTLHELIRHAGFGQRAKNMIGNVLKVVPETQADIGPVSLALRAPGQPSPFNVLRDILRGVNRELEDDGKRMLIIWDEFPDAVWGIAKAEGNRAAEDLLAIFKAGRENDEGQRIRWVFTGSVGFHHVLHLIGGHGGGISDLTNVEFGPLTPEWTRWLTASLLLKLGIDAPEQVTCSIADVAGGIPFVVEMMVKYVRDHQTPLPYTIRQAHDMLVAAASDTAIGANWTPLLSRVEDYYGDDASFANDILDHLARSPLSADQLRAAVSANHQNLDDVLSLLINDHYLQYDGITGLYSWKYPPLRWIWLARRRKH